MVDIGDARMERSCRLRLVVVAKERERGTGSNAIATATEIESETGIDVVLVSTAMDRLYLILPPCLWDMSVYFRRRLRQTRRGGKILGMKE